MRRAQKRGVLVRVKEFKDELISGLVKLNSNESPTRQGRPFAHYRKTFDEGRRDYSSFFDRGDFVGAYFGNELIWLVRARTGTTCDSQ